MIICKSVALALVGLTFTAAITGIALVKPNTVPDAMTVLVNASAYGSQVRQTPTLLVGYAKSLVTYAILRAPLAISTLAILTSETSPSARSFHLYKVLVPSLDTLLTTIRSTYLVSGAMVSAAQGLPPQTTTAVSSTSASINASVASSLASYGPTVDSLRSFSGSLNGTAATISSAGNQANAYIPQVRR